MNKQMKYAEFETIVIALYERKKLTPHVLDRIASRYRFVSMDSAGSQYLQAGDGKDLHQICIEVTDPTFPLVARGSSEDHDVYWEHELKKWEEIVHWRWGWQAYCTVFPRLDLQEHAA
jgi:hypothetical protein